MVATSQPLPSQAGWRILLEGGNAVDAAIAAAAVLNVVEPMMTGIGGDLFAIVYVAKGGELLGLKGSGRPPAAATTEIFATQGIETMPVAGIHSVTVPGTVDGWDQLLRRAGTSDLAGVLQSAIEYAEQGFPVSEVIAGQWADGTAKLGTDPDSAQAWLVEGRGPRAGDIFVNPGLGRSLRLLAQKGREAFYKGEIVQAIVAKAQALG